MKFCNTKERCFIANFLLFVVIFQVVISFLFAIFFSICVYGCIQVKDGVDMTDVVPKETKLAEFLSARDDYFSFYDISIITKDDFDYANKQEELDRLHKALSKVLCFTVQRKNK